MMNDGMPFTDPATITKCLEGLSGREYVSVEYVRFRIALLQAQATVCKALSLAISSSPQSKLLPTEQQKKSPAIGADDVYFDHALLNNLLESLATALTERGGDNEDLIKLVAATAREPNLLEQLARESAFSTDKSYLASLSRRLGTSPEGLLFFGRVLAAPFVSVAVQEFKKDADGAPSECWGCCPYCGSTPGLAKLSRNEGRRILFCSLCGESWEFARMACPFCANQGILEVLFVGTDAPRWNETCAQCKHYLKTIDERKLADDEQFIPLVEATASLYLDLIAEQEDYVQGLPYSAPQ
jgi:FdhE protein